MGDGMFAVERIKRIKEIVYERKKVDVITLSNELSVSDVTIRRDLEKLESENFLTRSHGGAILNEYLNNIETQLILPLDTTNAHEKLNIGKLCSNMVNDNDTIILGPGTTCRYIAKNLENKKNIKVITPDILIAIELIKLSEFSDVKVILTGGDVETSNYQLIGRIAEKAFDNFYVNISFVEVDGVSLDRGYSVETVEKGFIIKAIASASKDVVAVCDYTKFNDISFSPLGPVDMFKRVVSNEQTPDAFKEYYFQNNIQLITTFDVYNNDK
jgi:DeoR/GlpR family transcriptional regulator of sugar metabolism